MINKLTVIVSIFDKDSVIKKILDIFKADNNHNYNVVIINDGKKSNIVDDMVLHNSKNLGKFWTISELIKNEVIKTDYFLTIDPDDLLLGDINFKKLNQLAIKINNATNDFDYGVNKYKVFDHITKKKQNKFFHFKMKVFFTPNLIYSTANIKKALIKYKLDFEGKALSYFEDRLLLLLSYNKGNKKNFSHSFYLYNKNMGMTSNIANYKHEVNYAKSIMDTIINSKPRIVFNRKIKKYNINRVNLIHNNINK